MAVGKSFFGPAAAKVMLDDYLCHLAEKGIVDRLDSLSEREREVLQLIAGRRRCGPRSERQGPNRVVHHISSAA